MTSMIARRGRAIMLLCALLLIVGFSASWLAGGWMMRGRSSPVPAVQLPARDFRIVTPDGVSIAATLRPGRTPDGPAILLLHGVDASRASMAATATYLSARGYTTLTVDFRGHGQSDIRPRSFGWNEASDAHAAFRWLKRHQSGSKIAVIGVSMGGAASLLGSDGPLPADAVVLQAVYPDIRHAIRDRIAARVGQVPANLLEPLLSLQTLPRLGLWPAALSPIHALSKMHVPVLVIGGREDRYTPPDETIRMFKAAPADRSIWIVPTGDHAAVCALDTAEYHHQLLRFFQRTISAPAER